MKTNHKRDIMKKLFTCPWCNNKGFINTSKIEDVEDDIKTRYNTVHFCYNCLRIVKLTESGMVTAHRRDMIKSVGVESYNRIRNSFLRNKYRRVKVAKFQKKISQLGKQVNVL